MISSYILPPIAILCIFIQAIQQVRHLKKATKTKKQKESLKKATNSDLESRAYSQKYHAPHTIYSMYFFL